MTLVDYSSCRAEALQVCQLDIALYSELIMSEALPLFPINALRNQVRHATDKDSSPSSGRS